MLITRLPQDLITVFQQGGIFAYPTEAIYGLGCDPDNETAVRNLLALKKRAADKGLILIAADLTQVERYLKPLSTRQRQQLSPSYTTYTFPARDTVPTWLRGNYHSLAIRITRHPLVKQLCLELNSPVVSTSANVSGKPPARDFAEALAWAKQVLQKTADSRAIDAILEGETCGLTRPSMIRDGVTGQILRS